MNSLAPYSRFSVIASLLLTCAMLIVAGCAPNTAGEIISPDLGPKLVLAQSSGNVSAEPTAVPPKLAELAPDQIFAGVPDDVRQTIDNADIVAAETIALQYGCIGCHAVDPAEVKTGPTWHNVGDASITRVATESPALYLYQSIVDPNAFVTPGYQGNIMPQNFRDTMTAQEIGDMVAYLLQQNGQ